MSEIFRAHRHRIQFSRRISSRNSIGEMIYDWEPASIEWCEIRDNEITVRHNQNFAAVGWRCKIGKTDYNIVDVKDVSNKRLLKLTVQEVGHGRQYPMSPKDEQQREAFLWTRSTARNEENER